MDDSVELWEKPVSEDTYMIAGWRQWADAGSVSSALPRYLVDQLHARQIGRIRPGGFYLFQLPGMHELLRPQIKLENGYRTMSTSPENQVFYWQNERKGLVIFLGDEPHLNAEAYSEAFFQVAAELGVRKIASIGGVYAPVPYDKHRTITCSYSLPEMRETMEKYAVEFSSYEGGSSINSYFLDRAEELRLEYFIFYAMVPYYDLSQLSRRLHSVGVEQDYRAWHDLMVRVNHMFDLGLDLSDLRRRGDEITESLAARIQKMDQESPKAGIGEFMDTLSAQFTEKPFAPLDDVWERELKDLFGDEEA